MEFAPVTKKVVAFGSKQVFLPKFTIALIRTPRLSPYHAKFLVPLNFSKYDLRDYLFHAYNVKVHSIRSLVKQMPVRDSVKQPRHWFRPESEKYMTVEMDKPFVWPESPESWEPWARNEKEDSIRKTQSHQGLDSDHVQRTAAKSMRQQALKVLGDSHAWKWAEMKPKKGEKGEKGEKAVPAAKKATPKKVETSKPRKTYKTPVDRWEGERTPQMLGRELLKVDDTISAEASRPHEVSQ